MTQIQFTCGQWRSPLPLSICIEFSRICTVQCTYIPSSLLHRTTTSRKHFDVVYCTHSAQLYAVRCGFHYTVPPTALETRLYLRICYLCGAATRLSSSLHTLIASEKYVYVRSRYVRILL